MKELKKRVEGQRRLKDMRRSEQEHNIQRKLKEKELHKLVMLSSCSLCVFEKLIWYTLGRSAWQDRKVKRRVSIRGEH